MKVNINLPSYNQRSLYGKKTTFSIDAISAYFGKRISPLFNMIAYIWGCQPRNYLFQWLFFLLLGANTLFSQPINIDSLKTIWEFEEWSNKTRDDRCYIITALNFEKLLPGEFQCSSTVISENVFEVTCNLYQDTQKIKEVCFTVSLYPGVFEARNYMFEVLGSSTAPVEYLKSLYASQDITYGDVSFGRGFWGIGNCVFRINRQTDDSLYVEDVFQRIDDALMAVPQPTNELPAAISFSSIQPVENKWEISLHDSTGKRTVIVSSRDSLRITDNFSHIEVFTADDQENTVNIIIIEDSVHSSNTEIILDNSSILNRRHRSDGSDGADVLFLFRNNRLITWHPLPGQLQFQLFDCSGSLFRKWDCRGEQGSTSLGPELLKRPRQAILLIESRNGAEAWKQAYPVLFLE